MLRKILGVILIIISIWLLLLATGWSFPYNFAVSVIKYFRDNASYSIIIALLLLFGGIFLIKDRSIGRIILPEKTFRQNTGSGNLKISQAAVEDIIAGSIAGVNGFKSSRIKFKQQADGLIVSVYGFFPDERNNAAAQEAAQQTAREMEEKIRRNIENFSGIPVKEVTILAAPQLWGKPVRKK